MTHKRGDKLGDAKEQINKTLAEFDERVDHWHDAAEDDECMLCAVMWIGRRILDQIKDDNNPDYCSSDSPRSLLEGIEEQLDKRQFHELYMALRNLVYPPHALTTGDTSQRGMICATAEQKARASYAILEKE